MVGRYWVAVGYSDQEELARVEQKNRRWYFISCCYFSGREEMCRVTLIDSGASQSYILPEVVTLCELQCSPTLIHLELVDGSKVRSTQQT